MAEIAIATVVVCFALSRWRLSVILPYAIVASSFTSWSDWWILTMLVLAFGMVERAWHAVQD